MRATYYGLYGNNFDGIGYGPSMALICNLTRYKLTCRNQYHCHFSGYTTIDEDQKKSTGLVDLGAGTKEQRCDGNNVIMQIEYQKKGSVREWDIGKEVF